MGDGFDEVEPAEQVGGDAEVGDFSGHGCRGVVTPNTEHRTGGCGRGCDDFFIFFIFFGVFPVC